MDAHFAHVSGSLWQQVAPLLPPARPKPKGGRPPLDDRQVFGGIVYRLRTGCPWKALPSEFGSGSAVHARFQAWVRAGVFARVHAVLARFYARRRGLALHWSALDAAIVKAPKGGSRPVATRPTAASAAPNATF